MKLSKEQAEKIRLKRTDRFGKKGPKVKHVPLKLDLHAKQGDVLLTEAKEVLYGGQAGGGKSHLARVLAIHYAVSIKNCNIFLFRREFDDLIRTHVDGAGGFRVLLQPLMFGVEKPFVQITEGEIRFWNGSKIYLCHCHEEKDVYRYLSADIHVLIIDEATTFTDFMYRMLRSRVRVANVVIPDNFHQPLPRILLCSNPGGIGHQWVKSAFIDPSPPNTVWTASDDEGGMSRIFIPAGLDDNPSLNKREYEKTLSGLPPELAAAYRDGRWDVISGAYFPEFSHKHVLRPCKIPDHWLKFRAFDYGSYHPFSVGWWAVASEDTWMQESLSQKMVSIPKGAMICYREWYGAAGPNKGLDYVPGQIASGIHEREVQGEKPTYGSADPSIFNKNPFGTSIAEDMARNGVIWEKADNNRVNGWAEVRRRLVGINERPLIYWFDTCRDSIRTIPIMQHDKSKVEDLNSDMEDHAVDQIRYACTSRPYALPTPPPKASVIETKMPTLNDLYEWDKKFKLRRKYKHIH